MLDYKCLTALVTTTTFNLTNPHIGLCQIPKETSFVANAYPYW